MSSEHTLSFHLQIKTDHGLGQISRTFSLKLNKLPTFLKSIEKCLKI